MKVWVVILGGGGLYSIGYRGGKPCYVDKDKAEEMIDVISNYDPSYADGLSIKSIEADEDVLNALGLYVYVDSD